LEEVEVVMLCSVAVTSDR